MSAEQVFEVMDGLDRHQLLSVRKATISFSSLSVAAGLVLLYFYGMIHPSRRSFRHSLVLLLLFFDFIKSIVLVTYASLQLHSPLASPNSTLSFKDGLGWLTVFSIEGADATILAFAIHMALIIFMPGSISWPLLEKINSQLAILNPLAYNTSPNIAKNERGLSNFSHIVVFICLLFPLLTASIPFYLHNPYVVYVYCCFLRLWTGSWYFTWILRHVVTISILIIYVAIYLYIIFEFKKVTKSFKGKKKNGRPDMGSDADSLSQSDVEYDSASDSESDMELDNLERRNTGGVVNNIFADSLWYNVLQFLSMLVFPDVKIAAKLHGHSLTTAEDRDNIERLKQASSDESESLFISHPLRAGEDSAQFTSKNVTKHIQQLLQEEVMDTFTARKNQILRQMQIIFIYPISFCLLWVFPFINFYQILRSKHESMWSTMPSAISQSLTCLIDCVVFLIREKPWTLTEPSDSETLINSHLHVHSTPYERFGWRYYISGLPGYGAYRPKRECIETPDVSFSTKDDIALSTCGRGRYGYNDTDMDDYDPRDDTQNDTNDDDDMSLKDFLKMAPKKTYNAKTYSNTPTPQTIKRSSIASHRQSWQTHSSSTKTGGADIAGQTQTSRTYRVRPSLGSSFSGRSSVNSASDHGAFINDVGAIIPCHSGSGGGVSSGGAPKWNPRVFKFKRCESKSSDEPFDQVALKANNKIEDSNAGTDIDMDIMQFLKTGP